MWGFVLPYLFNPDKANLGAKVTFIFGALSVLSIVYLFLYQPETAGLSYERLDEVFIGGVKTRRLGGGGGGGGGGEYGSGSGSLGSDEEITAEGEKGGEV